MRYDLFTFLKKGGGMPEAHVGIQLEKAFEGSGQKKAISFYRGSRLETSITYASLDEQITLFTRYLCSRDQSTQLLKKGDRVILLMEKSIIWVVAYFSLLRLGMVAVPLNPGFKKQELAYLIKDSAPALILADLERKAGLEEIKPGCSVIDIPTHIPFETLDFFTNKFPGPGNIHIDSDDPALIIYTSGTTGNPKGAVLTHGNLGYDAANIIGAWELSKDDVLCHSLPLFHIHGLCFALHTAIISGAHIVMTDRFSADVVLERLSSRTTGQTVSVFMGVPTMYTRLIDCIADQRIDFSHLRLLTCGSAPLLERLFEKINTLFGKEPVEREGMSETGMNFSNPLHGQKKPGSIGLPMPNVAVRVVDPDTKNDVVPGNIGEFWLKSPSIIDEYFKKPDQTKQTFEGQWFKTGDLGRIDPDGYYFLTDRIKHIIITGGENVSAKEVESVINEIEGVKESAVVGIKDPEWGEKVAALVHVTGKIYLTPPDIIDACRQKLQGYKCPKTVIISKSIPKNSMGKVLKESVKQLFFQNFQK